MAYVYLYPEKVPYWVVVGSTKFKDKILSFFTKDGAHEFKDPSNGFMEHVFSYKNQGYRDVFAQEEVLLPSDFADRVFVEFIKKTHPNADVSVLNSYRLNRTMKNDSDYRRLFFQMLDQQEDVCLSQIFKIGEICHDPTNAKRPQWFISNDTLANIPNRLSKQVITIGDEESCDICTKLINNKSFTKDFTELLEECVDKLAVKE